MANTTPYVIAGGSGTYNLAPYSVASSPIQLRVNDTWEQIWLRHHALLAKIRDGGANWNKGTLQKGNALIIPVMSTGPTTAADGVTNANELTAATPEVSAGFLQAEYPIAHYRHVFWLRESEKQLIDNSKGNFKEGKLKQSMMSLAKVIAADLGGTGTGDEDAVVGVQGVTATANTVGKIDQSSVTDWASNVTTAAGAFDLTMLEDKIDAIHFRGGNANLATFSYTSSLNLFSRLRTAIAPAERIENKEFKVKYGFNNIEYAGLTCVAEYATDYTASGVIVIFDTDTWFYRGDKAPEVQPVQRLTGTDADEYVLTQWVGVACSNPARNGRITGVT